MQLLMNHSLPKFSTEGTYIHILGYGYTWLCVCIFNTYVCYMVDIDKIFLLKKVKRKLGKFLRLPRRGTSTSSILYHLIQKKLLFYSQLCKSTWYYAIEKLPHFSCWYLILLILINLCPQTSLVLIFLISYSTIISCSRFS